MAMIRTRTSFTKKENSVKGWKGFIPSSNWERKILNEEIIKFRFEYLNDNLVIKKGDESLLALSVLAYNQADNAEPEFDEDGILIGFWDSEYGEEGIDCPDNFSIICMAAVMQKKGRELRKLKKLAQKQKESWFLKEYENTMKYYRKEMMDK